MSSFRIARPSPAVLAVLMACLFAANASAAVIAYEPFNYPDGSELNGQNGGIGWSSPWGMQGTTAIPAGSNLIGAGSLAGPAGLPTKGNHAILNGNAGTLQMARFIPNIAGGDGTTTWISFLGQRQGTATDPTNPNGNNWPNNLYPRGANLGFFDTEAVSEGGSARERIAVGNSTTMNSADANHYDEWSIIPKGQLANREGPANHTPKWSELAWGVLRIDHVGDPTVSDSAWLWLNPDPSVEPSTASADVTILSGDVNARDWSNIDFVRPFVGDNDNTVDAANWRPPATIVLDEIRIGTSYADMSFVPEPSSCVLLALAGLSLLGHRRAASR